MHDWRGDGRRRVAYRDGVLYAQWFHYTRQSYGISRMYLRKAGAISAWRDFVLDGVIYALPLWGILYRSYQSPRSS